MTTSSTQAQEWIDYWDEIRDVDVWLEEMGSSCANLRDSIDDGYNGTAEFHDGSSFKFQVINDFERPYGGESMVKFLDITAADR